jgi:hypothetical protein
LKTHDWNQYKDKYVSIVCSADAIVPAWTYMLLFSHFEPVAKKIVFGDLKRLEEEIFEDVIASINAEDYRDQRVIIKGCSKREIPLFTYAALLPKRPCKSIMFGEPVVLCRCISGRTLFEIRSKVRGQRSRGLAKLLA